MPSSPPTPVPSSSPSPAPTFSPPTGCLGNDYQMIQCAFDGTVPSVQSSLTSVSGCSSSNVALVFHANLVGKFSNVLANTVICFNSSISGVGAAAISGQPICLTLTAGAANPSTGYPFSITVDPSNAQGTLIGLATYNCGSSCPSNLSPSWTLSPYFQSGYADLTNVQWQWSAAAYQVDEVNMGSISLYGSNCDGYPVSQTQCHVAGGRGGGGSNYCGSWCSTKSVCASPSPAPTSSAPTSVQTTPAPTPAPTSTPAPTPVPSSSSPGPTSSPVNYLCSGIQSSPIQCGFSGTVPTLDSTLISKGCSSSNVWIVFHANLNGNFASYTDNSVVCFNTSIANVPAGGAALTGKTCLTLKVGSPTVTNGNPYSITVDPTKSSGVLLGWTAYKCGSTCPSGLSPTWTLIPYVQSGSASLSGLSWTWSAAAYQVDTLDVTSIVRQASNCDGYPSSQTQCHVPGGRGGGGSNYCGSWCSTTKICP
eukprot:TRINITY_DN19090_c0_g1_i5.p1 TRINITY_DN19090_c0_g1~~TRINITY_DN19090_c0_g1_i5.p1  ORF type:complete len:479 (+),score=71.94 TRINITY_DN19090_c0_g1_i5:863-2299(+)